MSLSRDFKETIQARVERDPAFGEELLRQGVECLLSGDVDTGKAILRDYINSTIGFQELGALTAKSPTSLMRMFAPAETRKPGTCSKSSANFRNARGFTSKSTRSAKRHHENGTNSSRLVLTTAASAAASQRLQDSSSRAYPPRPGRATNLSSSSKQVFERTPLRRGLRDRHGARPCARARQRMAARAPAPDGRQSCRDRGAHGHRPPRAETHGMHRRDRLPGAPGCSRRMPTRSGASSTTGRSPPEYPQQHPRAAAFRDTYCRPGGGRNRRIARRAP